MEFYKFWFGGWALWIGKFDWFTIRISDRSDHLEIYWKGKHIYPRIGKEN